MAKTINNSVYDPSGTSVMTPLTIEEQQFVDAFIKYGVGSEAVKAVYPELCANAKSATYATTKARGLLSKPNIEAAILRRQEELRDERIADSREVMMYFTQIYFSIN